ncbi:uncharacterized protein MONBRDRAFT_9704 [Monosiga brevicollis MX1]|uniref:Enoyl reductase (ER) domain-containing protein n=1 Tax=Monosiga brevicollis TaxID=81824 RepID=A9V3I7_MONBE|nr:uncharacterized protein MONBRDRAFT_9704 [Monosiga brevicollis MX1]EDQ87820.1 predicted protein [Monosiga brevicollis MX1]|eukprot:XP_001747353.1 hypothetical protein [Monosiga brevicollis MX1]
MKMAAVIYEEAGDASVLHYTKAFPRPQASRDHVLIRTIASSVNPVDVKLRKHPVASFLRPLPKVHGSDVAGTVIEAPADSGFRVGDPVYAMMPHVGSKWGSTAEFASIPKELVAGAPTRIPIAHAATIPLIGTTVLQALAPVIKDWDGKTEGKKILIHAGTGGVGSFAIQYCKNVLSMYVAVTCSESSAALARELGADTVVDYKHQRFEDVIHDFDCVLDPMAFEYEERTLRSGVLAKGAHYIHIASSPLDMEPGDAGTDHLHMAIPEARPSHLVALSFRKFKSLFANYKYHTVFVKPNGDALRQITEWINDGRIKPLIDKEFSWKEVDQAHDYLAKGHVHGKLIINHVDDVEDTLNGLQSYSLADRELQDSGNQN